LTLLAWPARVVAHQLDEYLQATLVTIEPGQIRLQINLTPGVSVAEQALGLIDLNHDGVISTNESAAYAERVQRDLFVRLDGRRVELNLAAFDFPEPAELRTGWGIIQIEFTVAPGALAGGAHKLTVENRHQPVASVYLFNAALPKSPSILIDAQNRNQNQSMGEIVFNFHPPSKPYKTTGMAVSLAALSVVLGLGLWQAR